jgi:hypothetical protein
MNTRGEGKVMFDLCNIMLQKIVILSNYFLEHIYHINQGIPVYK